MVHNWQSIDCQRFRDSSYWWFGKKTCKNIYCVCIVHSSHPKVFIKGDT